MSVQCRTASQIKGRLILTDANRPFWFSAIGIFAFLKSSLSSGRRSHDRNKLSVSRCPVRFQSCRRAAKLFRRRPRRRHSCLARKPFPKHFYSSVQSLCKHRTSWVASNVTGTASFASSVMRRWQERRRDHPSAQGYQTRHAIRRRQCISPGKNTRLGLLDHSSLQRRSEPHKKCIPRHQDTCPNSSRPQGMAGRAISPVR